MEVIHQTLVTKFRKICAPFVWKFEALDELYTIQEDKTLKKLEPNDRIFRSIISIKEIEGFILFDTRIKRTIPLKNGYVILKDVITGLTDIVNADVELRQYSLKTLEFVEEEKSLYVKVNLTHCEIVPTMSALVDAIEPIMSKPEVE